MGIHDRDYYRAPRSDGPSPRSRKQPSTARLALFWIAVMAITFSAIRFGPTLRAPAPAVVPAPVESPSARPMQQPTPPPPAARPTPFEPSRALPPVNAPIYRCGSHYSHEPCAGGRVIDGPVASGFDSRPSERLARLVAEGRAADGDTSTTVSRTTTTVGQYGDRGSMVGVDRIGGCSALAAEIAEIDRAARQPQPAHQQDRLRARRRQARDQQVALHC